MYLILNTYLKYNKHIDNTFYKFKMSIFKSFTYLKNIMYLIKLKLIFNIKKIIECFLFIFILYSRYVYITMLVWSG